MSILNTLKSNKNNDGYYHIDKLVEAIPDAKYYVVYSLRSNGKSYSALEYILKNYLKGKGQGAIIRRYDLDFKQRRGGAMFAPLVSNGLVRKYSHDNYNGITYQAGEFYLVYKNEETGEIESKSAEPFCYGFSLTGNEHDKSTGYPGVTTILFDEFISRDGYLTDEFVLLMNQISTIIRRRDNVKIFMMGNTINPYNPYFDEMGLNHARQQQMGTVDIYEYGDTGLKVACEYAEKPVDNPPKSTFTQSSTTSHFAEPKSTFTPKPTASVIPESMRMQDDDEDLYISPSDVLVDEYFSDNDFEEF